MVFVAFISSSIPRILLSQNVFIGMYREQKSLFSIRFSFLKTLELTAFLVLKKLNSIEKKYEFALPYFYSEGVAHKKGHQLAAFFSNKMYAYFAALYNFSPSSNQFWKTFGSL